MIVTVGWDFFFFLILFSSENDDILMSRRHVGDPGMNIIFFFLGIRGDKTVFCRLNYKKMAIVYCCLWGWEY